MINLNIKLIKSNKIIKYVYITHILLIIFIKDKKKFEFLY